MQATPTPRFVDLQIDIPEFTHVSDAEAFLAKIALLCARGHLDIQSAQELSGLVKLWIDSQYQREELAIKQLTAGTTEHEQTIRVVGGLPELPGTSITMPTLDGHAVNGHDALAPPVPQIEGTNSTPGMNSTNGSDGETQGGDPVKPCT